jgi:hypothetical protein
MANFHHLKMALEENYKVAVDWTGLMTTSNAMWTAPCLGTSTRHSNQHPVPTAPQDAPYTMAPVQYGAKVQQVKTNTTSPLPPAGLKRVQDITGTLLYYA